MLMKNIVSVALVAGLSVVGFVACSVAAPPASSPDGSDDSEAADTAKKDTSSTKKSSSSSSGGAAAAASSSSSSGGGGASSDAGAAGSSSGDDSATCNTVNGSCKTTSVCNEYYGGDATTQKKVCDSMKGTWSDDPCDTTEAVGGCKQITKAANYCGGAISWMFAPATEDTLAGSCPSPGVVIHPGDEE